MTSDDHAIWAEDLRRSYRGGFEAVSGITFSVPYGEIFALLGTNGAGKTSTVELLEGLARPTGGRVRVLGRDPYTERALVRPRTGVMLQEGGFPSDLTVTETLRMWGGCTSGARPVGEALGMVGLAGRARVRVKQLSGGERRRLDLALALLGRPDVLFLDEPSTGLDAEGRRDTWELVRSLRDCGTTVLLTTHYLEEAESLADRLAIMHAGRIVTSGTPAEVTASRPVPHPLPAAAGRARRAAAPGAAGGGLRRRQACRDPCARPPGGADPAPAVGAGRGRAAGGPGRPLGVAGGSVPGDSPVADPHGHHAPGAGCGTGCGNGGGVTA